MSTVVLRDANVKKRILQFHTDRRSAKCAELAANSRISLHFYNPAIKTQIRLEAGSEIFEENSLTSAAW